MYKGFKSLHRATTMINAAKNSDKKEASTSNPKKTAATP